MADAEQSGPMKCLFCGGSSESAENGGKIISKADVSAHQYCLYFSSGLAQRGNEEKGEGLSGFLSRDVCAEVRRSLQLRCLVCGERGASIGCAVRRCRCVGHYSCLLSKNYIFQHFDKFETFCPSHCPKQAAVSVQQSECPICLLSINAEPGFTQIYCPNCKTYFHRNCVQNQGLSAGRYYMRCPVCNDKDSYMQEMLKMGIAVPEKDAEWERSGQFIEDGEASKYCRAESCLCPLGRSHHSGIGKYKMRKCVSCGQWMGHVLCLKGQPEQCLDCVSVPLQQPKPSAHPSTTQARSSAQARSSVQCTCAVCLAKSSPYLGGASSSRARKNLTVSIPRRLVRTSHKSLTVSIPLKRLQHSQRKGLKVTISRADLCSLPRKMKGQMIVHPMMRALSRQYPRMRVLSCISLPLYTPQQLLNLHKQKTLHSEKQSGRMNQSAEEESLQSEKIKSKQPLQSEMNWQDESRQLSAKNQPGKVESRENFVNSPLLQTLQLVAIPSNSQT